MPKNNSKTNTNNEEPEKNKTGLFKKFKNSIIKKFQSIVNVTNKNLKIEDNLNESEYVEETGFKDSQLKNENIDSLNHVENDDVAKIESSLNENISKIDEAKSLSLKISEEEDIDLPQKSNEITLLETATNQNQIYEQYDNVSSSTTSDETFYNVRVIKQYDLFKTKKRNYEASDEDIYTESFPINTMQVSENRMFKPVLNFLGVVETDPDEYNRLYNTEFVNFNDLPAIIQLFNPIPNNGDSPAINDQD